MEAFIRVALTAAMLAAADSSPKIEPIPSPAATAGAMAPRLCRTGAALCLTWVEGASDGARRLRFARLERGAWTEAVTIAESKRLIANWADTPSVVRGGDGALVAYWAEQHGGEPHASDVVLARSTDDGRTWRRLGLAHDDGTATEHGFTTLILDGKGVLAAWLDGRKTTGGGAMTLRAGTVGATAASRVLDARVCDCCGTSSALTTAGPIIVYRDRDVNEVRDISIVRRLEGKWTEPALVNSDGWSIPGCPVNGPAVAAKGNRVVVAWYTYAQSQPRVKAAFSTDSGATFGQAVEVDAPRAAISPIGRVDVTLDDQGFALVSWMTSNREDGELLTRQVSSDGMRGALTRVVRTGSSRQAGFPRQQRDGKDVVFAWTEPGGIQLARVALSSLPPPVEQEKQLQVPPPVVAATPAPEARDVSVRTLEGEPISLARLRNGPVLVNFWATWCEPCRMELPALNKLDREHKARGLTVIGVSIDATKAASEVKAFAVRRGVSFQLWHDPRETLSSAFGVQTLPASFLLDSAGRVVWSASGAIASDDAGLAAAIESVLPR